MNQKTTWSIIFILMTAGTAAAGFTLPWMQPQPQQSNEDRFTTLYMQVVSPLNTPHNLNIMTGYMDSQRIKAVKIHVNDLNKAFYVISGAGTTLTPPNKIDRTYNLSSRQIEDIAGMLKDGNITAFEKVQLFLMGL